MIRRGAQFVDDDDDGPSEATIQLTAKMASDFRKAFPLRDESSSRRPTPVATPSLAQISKRLNFEDSISSSSMISQSVKVAELNEEVGCLRRQLCSAHADIQRLKLLGDNEKKKSELLEAKTVQLKREKELIRQSYNIEMDKMRDELQEVMLSRDKWQEAGKCFHRYFQCAKARLTVAEKEICLNGLLNEDLKHALNSAWTSAECNVEDIDENLHEVMKAATLSLEELDRNLYAGAEITGGISSVDRKNEDDELNDSATTVFVEGSQSIICNQNESILNSTLANTSIDYEKDERIQRLEMEISRLQDREKVLLERSQKYLLMEEKIHSAEHRNYLLEKSMEEILMEFNSLRSACAKKMFDIADGSSHDRVGDAIKRIQSLSESVEKLEEQRDNARLEAERARKNYESLAHERDTLLKNVDQLTNDNHSIKCCLNEEKEACATLKRTIEMKSAELACIQDEVVLLRDHVHKLESELAKHVTIVPTDAGNETQILHLRNNPMQCAVNDLGEVEKERLRKRKADTSVSLDESCEVKRAREEHINALENQLMKSEREKEQAIRLQADIAKKYREISTTLTGYQIKLKDIEEGICCVNSVYDDTVKQFVFKYNASTGIVDLLDVGQDELSQGRPWEQEMQKYIGERNSIPGFLAAVTLQLEARRNLQDVERTNTSILHED